MIIFLLLILVILFSAHWIVYTSVIYFFSVSETGSLRQGMGWVFFGLAISFIVASTLAHWWENTFTRSFYYFSGLWLGLLVNLLLASAAAWLIASLSERLSWNLQPSVVAGSLFSLAAVVSVWGAWKAMHPVVRSITVEIPNLSEEWNGKTLIQLSDIHLGHVYRKEFLQGVVNQVNELHPKAVVITGDLFDGMDGRLEELVTPLDDIRSENGVLFINGNHETYLGTTQAFNILNTTNIRILDDEMTAIDGLYFIGVSYPERGVDKDIVKTAKRIAQNLSYEPKVLLYHAPVSIKEFLDMGINLQLAGHTHQGQQFPFNLVTRLVHGGYDYGQYQVGENYTLYTTSGVGTWGPAMRVGTQSEIIAITLKRK